jgi:hypothetical protein
VTFVVSVAACGDNKKPVFDDAGMMDMGMVDAGDDAPPDAGCPTGQTLCGTSCVDVKTDNDHCGDCDTDCGTGTCQTNNGKTTCCPTGQTNCDGTCVDTTTNADNCGTCGTDCGTNECKSNGTSSVCCPANQINCAGQCVDTDSDAANCGGCVADGQGAACTGNTDTCCGGSCVNVDLDNGNCGTCGTACTATGSTCHSPSTGTVSVCCAANETNCNGVCTNLVVSDTNCGGCAVTCDTGANEHCQAPDQGNTPACCLNTDNNCNGTCSNPLTDNNNCGACGNQCGGTDTCQSGVCCGPNEINCGGVCVDPDTNPTACGGCTGGGGGTACTNPSPLCSDGTCTAGCDISETQCGNACVTTATDPNNCGACGTVCAATELCTAGACVPTTTGCGTGKVLCGGVCVDISTDENNCGGCPGTTCASTETCDGGLCCAAGSVNTGGICCPAGWLNCSGVCKDPTDDDTCNSCNTDCGTGTCTTDVGGTFCCPAGQTRCGATCVDVTTDETNCGFCGAACTGADQCNPANPTTAGSPICCDPTTELNCGGGTCINKLTDDNNCGMCGVSCGAAGECSSGKCCPNGSTNYIVGANSVCCAAGTISCDGITCIDLDANSTCGTTCGDIVNCTQNGEVCVNNACTANCGALTNCTGSCFDLDNDPAHCGGCNSPCPAVGQTCSGGVCSSCPIGPAAGCNGQCVDTQSNNTNCGGCAGAGGDTCDINEQCQSGHCCATGTTWCATANACVDLQTSNTSCGTCGNVCGTGETCTAGVCGCGFNQTSCPSGCITPGVDPQNCGTCGNVCGSAGNAGKPYCVSNGCVASCPAPLTGCGTGANAECANLDSDNDNCGACNNKCTAGKGCSNGQCVTKFPLLADPAKCVGGGPPLVVPTGVGQTTCTGNLGAVSFLFGLCSRTNIGPLSQALFTDGFNSLEGPYKSSCSSDSDCGTTGKCIKPSGLAGTCAGGGVGINGGTGLVAAETSKAFHVGGDFWVFGTAGLSSKGDITVRQRTYTKSNWTVSGNDRLVGEARINGPTMSVGGSGNLVFNSTLFTTAMTCNATTVPVGTSTANPKCTPATFDPALKEPCGSAADLIPVKSIVEYFRDPAHNDNAAINLPYNALANPSNPVRLELPCGYYYLDSLGGNQDVTIVVKGRTALFIGGAANINVEMIFDVEPTASIDMFIGGVVRIAHPITLGSPAYPRLTRMYIGSGAVGGGGASCTSVSQCASGLCSACGSSPFAACSGTGTCNGGTGLNQAIDMSQGGYFNGLLWAGYGSFSSSNPVEMYGSIFTNYMDFAGALTVHYDNGAAKTGNECPPIPTGSACESARDCGGTKACINNTCAACTQDSQCIPPQVCNAGVCGF